MQDQNLETLLKEIFIKPANEVRIAQPETNAAAACNGHCASGQCHTVTQEIDG